MSKIRGVRRDIRAHTGGQQARQGPHYTPSQCQLLILSAWLLDRDQPKDSLTTWPPNGVGNLWTRRARLPVGSDKKADAEAFFQNILTRIYFRRSDSESMAMIQKEVGNKDVSKISIAISEGGQQSEMSYLIGRIVDSNLAVSETKTAMLEEKPFFEIEELRTMPNFVGVVTASTGDETLPAAKVFLRPSYVFNQRPEPAPETIWYDWPSDSKKQVNLATVDEVEAWTPVSGPVDLEAHHAFAGDFLGVRILATHVGKGLFASQAGSSGAALNRHKGEAFPTATQGSVEVRTIEENLSGSASEDPVSTAPVRQATEAVVTASATTRDEFEDEEEEMKSISPPPPLDLGW